MCVHRRRIAGLAVEALLVSSSMFLDTLSDAEGFFDISVSVARDQGSMQAGMESFPSNPGRLGMLAQPLEPLPSGQPMRHTFGAVAAEASPWNVFFWSSNRPRP